MSDTPIEEPVDLTKMGEDELRDRYAKLSEAITTLQAAPSTFENATAINQLKVARNEVAATVNDIVRLRQENASTDDVVDLAPEGEDAPDAEAEGAPETEAPAPADATPEVAAPAAAPAPVEATASAAPAEPTAEAAPGTTDQGRDAAVIDDGPTNTNGGTPVADTPAPTPEPTAAETAAVVEAAEQIASGGVLAGTAVTAGMGRPVADPASARPKVGLLAKGGQTTFAEGTALDMTDMGQAISEIQSAGRDSGQGIVAALPAYEVTPGMPAVLTQRLSATDSTALIAETVAAHNAARAIRMRGGDPAAEMDAVTAAICTPLDIVRDVPECGVTYTPFADLFPQRGVGRLGFQFFPQMALIDTNPNINVWTEDAQDNVDEGDPATWKPSPLIQCLPAVSVTAEELVASAQVDNSTQISQPEQVEQFIHKLAVQRARRREQYLQAKFDALASGYTFTGSYGALVSLLQTGELLGRLVYGERLDEGDYDLVLEPDHFRKLLLDEDARIFGDTLASRRDGVIAKLKDELGVGQVVVLRDFRTDARLTHTAGYAALNAPGNAPSAMPRLYDSNRVRYVPASAFIFGATGEDSTGWETDPQLTRQNRMQWFSKEWLLLAKHGCHPAAYVDLTSCGNGARAEGITPETCTSQSS